MHTFWKLAAVAVVVLGITAVTSTLTTAYLMRVPVSEPAPLAVTAASGESAVRRPATVEVARAEPARRAIAPRPALVSRALVPLPPSAASRQELAAAEPGPAVPDPVVASAPVATMPSRAEMPDPEPVASAASATTAPRAPGPAATECDAGGRTWKIAKPGLIGTAVGAGLGAAGGAIANGGKGAGQGAIIGGLAGAALGSGYGAYRTKNECGNVFSGDRKVNDPRAKIAAADDDIPGVAGRRASASHHHAAPFAVAEPEQITIYHTR